MSLAPLVGVVMGSRNDYAVMKSAVDILREFGVPHEARIVSAHRTPDLLFTYVRTDSRTYQSTELLALSFAVSSTAILRSVTSPNSRTEASFVASAS